jgi:hypothetical protein
MNEYAGVPRPIEPPSALAPHWNWNRAIPQPGPWGWISRAGSISDGCTPTDWSGHDELSPTLSLERC